MTKNVGPIAHHDDMSGLNRDAEPAADGLVERQFVAPGVGDSGVPKPFGSSSAAYMDLMCVARETQLRTGAIANDIKQHREDLGAVPMRRTQGLSAMPPSARQFVPEYNFK